MREADLLQTNSICSRVTRTFIAQEIMELKLNHELLPVMDLRRRTISLERRSFIHRKNLIHCAVHIIVFNERGELLIQKRSANKDRYPLFWDISVGGHLLPGETILEAAARELQEELGITDVNVEFLQQLRATPQTGQEHIYLFKTTYTGIILPDKQEISAIRWVTPKKLQQLVLTNKLRVTPAIKNALTLLLP